MYVGKIISQCEKHFFRFITVYLKRPSGHFDCCVIFLHDIMCETLLAIYYHTYSLHTIRTPVVTWYLHGYKLVHWSTQAHSEFQIRNMFWHTCANVICDVLPLIVPSLLSMSSSFQCCFVEPFTREGQNATTDNFFTTVKLAGKLKAKNTSRVSTVNRIRREIS